MMRRRLFTILGLIIALAGSAVYIDVPGTPGLPFSLGERDLRELELKRGLDLQGGLHVVLQADLAPGKEISDGAMEAVRTIIENRVNALGVAEPVIQLEGNDRIIVELPGVSDPDEAIKLFKETGRLEFLGSGFIPLEEGLIASPDDPGVELVITGAGLEDARVGFDQLGSPEIQFQIKPEAAERFAQYTGDNIDSYLSIALDGLVIQTAVIRAQISTSGSISGSLTSITARNVAIQLRYGALPVPLRVEQNLTIGPTLGQESLDRSVRAGIVGAILVTLFMVAYYRLPGLVAAVALALYTALVLAIFKLIPVTLTLSGIAGFILSVGMAVDANILIFERSKEELRGGLTLTSAIQIGFSRAWNSIRDSNVSTLITCFVLWQFGSGIVRGFALTLAIGVLVSMFSAITVSRTMLLLLVRWPRLRNAALFGVGRISGVRA